MLFTKEHEWIKISSGIGTVGITDFAQNKLGDIVHIDLPTVGGEVQTEEVVGAVESVKAVSDVYSPVSGIVKEINMNLEEEPELLNSSPEEEGWIY